MRKIEFRGKTKIIAGDDYNHGKKDGEWVYGYYFDDLGLARIRQFEYDRADYIDYEVDPSSICQYTGRTDKNGKKIFEGDIVIFNNQVFEVVFEHGSFGLECHQLIEYDNIKSDIGLRRYNGCYSDNFISLWEIYWNFEDIKEVSELIEVIDNIYDNHEVLEVNNDTK